MIRLLSVLLFLLALCCAPLHAQQQGAGKDADKPEQEAPVSPATNSQI